MDTIYEGAEVRVGSWPQAQDSFGTRRVDGDTFTEHHITGAVEIDCDVKAHQVSIVSGSKNPDYDTVINNVSGSIPKFPVQMPFSYLESDVHLVAYMQLVSESATPFTKTLTPFTTHPDFTAADEGHYATWIKRFPEASTSWALEGCIASGFKLYGERDGLVMLDTNWCAHGEVEFDANPSGTWERGLDGPGGTDAQDEAYGHLFVNDLDACTLSLDGGGVVALAIEGFAIEMTHEVQGVSPDGSGSFQNWGISKRTGTVEITCLKDSQVEAALASWIADGYFSLVMRWGDAGATAHGELQVTVTGKINSIVTDEGGLIGAVIKGGILSADGAAGCTIIMTNTIERGWPVP